MRQISSVVLAFALLASPAALAASGAHGSSCCAKKGPEATADKKCSPAEGKDHKKCDLATCKDHKKCTPEEKAKCAAMKNEKAEAPTPPKS